MRSHEELFFDFFGIKLRPHGIAHPAWICLPEWQQLTAQSQQKRRAEDAKELPNVAHNLRFVGTPINWAGEARAKNNRYDNPGDKGTRLQNRDEDRVKD